MMAFNRSGSFSAAFNDIRIDCALYEVVDFAEFISFSFKYADEFFTDDFAFAFRVGNAGEFAEEAVFSVNADEVHVELFAEYLFNLVAFVFAQETVVNEYAGELFADSFMHEYGCNGGVDSAA